MGGLAVDNPWLFTGLSVVVWVLLWVGIEVLLFDGDMIGAAIPGAVAGLAFALFSIVLRRQFDP